MANASDPSATAWKDPGFDLPRLAMGALVTAALSVALATLFLYVARTTGGPNVGPTSATLSDAFSTLFGAALGLAVGSGLTASLARRGSRMATGLVAGSLAYAAVLLPIVVVTRPSDVSVGEALGTALAFGVPLGLVVVMGSMVGAGLGSTRRIGRGGRNNGEEDRS